MGSQIFFLLGERNSDHNGWELGCQDPHSPCFAPEQCSGKACPLATGHLRMSRQKCLLLPAPSLISCSGFGSSFGQAFCFSRLLCCCHCFNFEPALWDSTYASCWTPSSALLEDLRRGSSCCSPGISQTGKGSHGKGALKHRGFAIFVEVGRLRPVWLNSVLPISRRQWEARYL